MPEAGVEKAGRFITLEGGEGAGKSTQTRILVDRLRATGRSVVATREPGGTPGAEQLRGLLLSGAFAWAPLAETLLHVAARADHVAAVIRPALAAGSWVVCDRFSDSTMAYQGFGQGMERATITTLTGLLGLVPDLTLVLDVDPDEALRRLAARGVGQDRYERLGAAFFAKVREGFAAIAAAEPARCVMVAADDAPEAVGTRIWDIVTRRLLT